VEVTVQSEINDVFGKVIGFHTQLDYITSKAINTTTKKVKEAEQAEIKRQFKNPTPYTVRGVFARFSSKRRLFSKIWLAQGKGKGKGPGEYLRPEIGGGEREQKEIAAYFEELGLIPPGYYMVPAKGVRLNKFGNVTKGMMRKWAMLSKASDSNFFCAEIRGTWMCVQRMRGGAIRPKLIFVPNAPSYSPAYNFERTGFAVINKVYSPEFAKEYKKELTNFARRNKIRFRR